MKKFFVLVMAVTSGILLVLTLVGGGWWSYANRAPDLKVELSSFADWKCEDKRCWALMFGVENGDSEDYIPGEWQLIPVRNDGMLVPRPWKSTTVVDNVLYAEARTLLPLVFELNLSPELFWSADDMDESGSRIEAEKYLENLTRFRDRFKSDEYILLNDKLKLRAKISVKSYYEKELARREAILARQGDPVDDPDYRVKLESTPFCDTVEIYPCREGNMIVGEVIPPPENFSPEEHQKRLASLPDCEDSDKYPCRMDDFILEKSDENK